MISCIFNHYDFAYSTIIDTFIPYIVQKCVDFSRFFIQYMGYYYDFIFIFIIYNAYIYQIYLFPYIYYFFMKANKCDKDFITIVFFRIVNCFIIIYYFGNASFFFNFCIISISLFCIEIIFIIRRICVFIQIINVIKGFIICLKLI